MRWILLVFLVAFHPAMAAGPQRPNVVIILADDLGAGDLGCYSPESKIPTPNLDKLAAAGMKFTNAYCPVSGCSPTRYGLMTGGYPWRCWKKRGVLGNWDRPMIPQGRLTLPGMLRDAGYVTGGFGKWHLGSKYATLDGRRPEGEGRFKGPGRNIDLSQPVMEGPMDRGFDEWKGMICASELLMVEGRKATARISHEVYAPLGMPGFRDLPQLELTDLLPKASREAVDFIGRRASAQEPFFLYFAPYVPHIPLAVNDSFKGKTKAGDYGDYVHELDHHVGLVMDALEKAGVRENTLVIFASDNGSQFLETGEGHHPNGILRGKKAGIYEGGTRTPFIASLPGRIAAGSNSDALLALIDIIATVAPLTGCEIPSRHAPDSLDQSPILLGKAPEKPIRNEILMMAARPDNALRQDGWKFIRRDIGKSPGELYNLATDPSEKTNLADAEPERFKAMAARFKELMEETRRGEDK